MPRIKRKRPEMTTAARKVMRRRAKVRERETRLREHYRTMAMFKELFTKADQRNDSRACAQLHRKMRTLAQQIRYMGGDVE